MNLVAIAATLFILKLVAQCIREDIWPIEEPELKQGDRQ